METESRPPCFGVPEQVTPKDEQGVIQPQHDCVECAFVKACLQQALILSGVLPKPVAQNPVVSRLTSFLKRWSDRKLGGGESDSETECKQG